MSGYSGTPLFKKLGIKPGFRIRCEGPPANYRDLLEPLPDDVAISNRYKKDIDVYHLFVKSHDGLKNRLGTIVAEMNSNSMIWVSWPKKSSKVKSDVTEDVVRKVALPLGLVDIKVCAVDDVWSGLKLVIRKKLRT